MKKSLLLLFLVMTLAGVYNAKAQTTDTVKTGGWFHHDRQFSGTAQVQFTYRQSDLSQLNRVLTNDHLQALGENDIWVNASLNHSFNKLILEGGVGFTPVSSSDANNVKAEYNQYQVYGHLCYNVLDDPNMRLFPFAGLNFSLAVLDIEDKNATQNTSDFSTEIATGSYSKTLYQPNFGIDLGVGFDYLIPVKPKNMGCFMVQRQIPIGVRAGYYINAARGDWRINDNYKLDNGPSNSQSAVFISVNIGLGFEVQK
jgi:hypothetical protein